MQIPHFPESHHPIVKSLFHYSDRELLTLFQHYPEQGKYFVAIFCRYSAIVYTLMWYGLRSPVQADYLFALTWRHIYYEMGGLDPRKFSTNNNYSFQSWLVEMAAICVNQVEMPPAELIHYSLSTASPPLWCYLEQSLVELPDRQRLMVLLAQTFHWSEAQIAAYLQTEGEEIALPEVSKELQQGYQRLEAALPDDVRQIYLSENPKLSIAEPKVNAVVS
ncbi:MAG: sigma-70 region 4 domain-containing protein [Cyanosarcina radialis HA8281-LM2]|nr:sigma-70 region 4 domain-containing protein [Cyanosarcina radialis HA8281-LM2]